MTGQGPLGMKERKEDLDRYIGKYVIIYPISGSVFTAGKLVSKEDGWVVLNPFQGGRYDPEKGLERRMINEDSLINITNIHAVEPTTKESLEAYCEWNNRQGNSEDGSRGKSQE